MDVLTVGAIGPKRSLTPEGFLLCEDVVFSRSGELIYGPGEVPVTPGPDGLIYVERTKQETTRADTIASFQGKAVVNEHPDTDVTPDNWKSLAIGTVLNVRASTADEEGGSIAILVCDMLITDAQAIKDVNSGKREVSAGYDADYEETEPGQALQTDIIGNHIALVERGRCGPRCSIGDHHHTTVKGKTNMAATKNAGTRRVQLKARIRQAFRDAEAAALDDLDDNAPDMGDAGGSATSEPDDSDGGHTHIHVHMDGGSGGGAPASAPPDDDGFGDDPGGNEPDGDEGDPTEQRFAALEAGHQQILQQLAAITAKLGGGEQAPPEAPAAAPTKDSAEDMPETDEEGNPRAPTQDSAALARSWQALIADVQVLAPGFRTPTFDAAAKRATTVDTMCALRRRTLAQAAQTLDTRQLIERIADAPMEQVSKLTCDAVAPLFRATALAKRAGNNVQAPFQAQQGAHKAVTTVADISAAFARMYPSTPA